MRGMRAPGVMFGSQAAASAIVAYQRFISPYKGFRCAHRALHGGPSCSEFARREVESNGLLRLVPTMRVRSVECAAAAQSLRAKQVLDYESKNSKATRRHHPQQWNPPMNGNCSFMPFIDNPIAECLGEVFIQVLGEVICSGF